MTNSPQATEKQPIKQINQNQGQVVAIIILLVVLALIIGGLYLAQATTNISTARDIELLNQRRGRVERDNERLRADIARLQSLDSLYTRAAELGFEEADPEDIQYLVVDGYIYNQPAPTTTPIVITPTPETYEENFAGWLKRQFDALRDQFQDWAN